MIVIKEISFCGKLDNINTSDEKMWKSADGLKVFSGDFVEWYTNPTFPYNETISEFLIKNNEDLIIKIIRKMFRGRGKGIVLVSRFDFHFIAMESVNGLRKLQGRPRENFPFLSDGDFMIMFLHKDGTSDMWFRHSVNAAIKDREFNIGELKKEFWDIYLAEKGLKLDEFMEQLSNLDSLEERPDGTIGFKGNGTKVIGDKIVTEMIISSERYTNSNFIGRTGKETARIDMKNMDLLNCTFSNLEINAMDNDNLDQIIHVSQIKHGSTIYFSQCVFTSCTIKGRKQYCFDNCIFTDCTFSDDLESTFYEPKFFRTNKIKDIWRYVEGYYTVNGVRITYDPYLFTSFIICEKGVKEYPDPGHMIAGTHHLAFKDMGMPAISIFDGSGDYDAAVKRALKLFYG